jgi:hypothetical protein
MQFRNEIVVAEIATERRACLWTCSDKGRKQAPRGSAEYKKGCGWTNVSTSKKWATGEDWQGKCMECGKRQRLHPMGIRVMQSKEEAIGRAAAANTNVITDRPFDIEKDWF